MSSIFISHSSRDNAIAEQVKARLEQWGHRSVFLDFDPQDGVPAGSDWEKELYARLRECRAVVVLCSQASMRSRWTFAEITHAMAVGKFLFPIKIDMVQIDPILTNVQVIDATGGWDAAYQRLEKGLLSAGLDPNDLFDWDGTRPPYPGLMAFQERDAAIFFGRDKEIREGQALLNRLQMFGESRLTLMLGASGSGKSSLMLAGLLPRLKRDQRWIVIDPFRPLQTPFYELATVFSKWLSQNKQGGRSALVDVAHVRDRIHWDEHDTKKSIDAFLELLKEVRGTTGSQDATVLLMIDQCEELLTAGANGGGDRFLVFLRAVLDRENSGLLVLATLRSDFLGSFQDHPAMRGLRVETFPVPQMEVDDFASVIEGPAKIAGLELGPGLVQAMISDTKTSDALPLLAFTLRELYEGFGEDMLLTLEEYRDKLGRLDGCLARAAEAVLSAKLLTEEVVSDLRTALLTMVRVNDREQYATQPVKWDGLPGATHEVLERFVAARLLISGGEERTLEIAHVALVRAWPRLARWIEQDREDLFALRRAEIEAGEWERQGYDLKYLWHADRLKKLQELVARGGGKFVKETVRLFMAPQPKLGARLDDPALSHQERFTIGQSLATIGDRRPGVGLKVDGLPDIEWIKISGGQVKLEHVDHVFEVKPFRIAKYLVTNEQFAAFLKAEDGYGNKKWWMDIEQRNEADQPEWQDANAPRETVSWFEAIAFSRWLSSRMKLNIRLPTEWEWQQAATGEDPRREYPWEGGWDASRCNSDDSRLKRTAAVGMYPAGATQQGVLDMAGNVWEWCLNTYREADTTITKGGMRVVRGGSWDSARVYLRASCRVWDDADFRGSLIGFRLAQDIDE